MRGIRVLIEVLRLTAQSVSGSAYSASHQNMLPLNLYLRDDVTFVNIGR
jgi:hypothetical protein